MLTEAEIDVLTRLQRLQCSSTEATLRQLAQFMDIHTRAMDTPGSAIISEIALEAANQLDELHYEGA